MPKDSPCSDGAHRTSAPARRAATSSSLSMPSQRTRSDSGCRRRWTSLAGPSPATHRTAGRSHFANASRSTLQALALLVAPEEQHGRAALLVAYGSADSKRCMSTPLNSTSNSPPLERTPVSRAASETATLISQPPAHQLGQRLEQRHPPAHPGPVVRADHRERCREHEAVGGHGRQRLVQVQHVEAARAHEPLAPAPPRSATAPPGPPIRWTCNAVGRPITKCSPATSGRGTPASAGPSTVTSWPSVTQGPRPGPIAWPCTPPGRVQRVRARAWRPSSCGRSASSGW